MAHVTILLFIAILIFVPSTLSQKGDKSGEHEQQDVKKHFIKIRCLVNPQLCHQKAKLRNRSSENVVPGLLYQSYRNKLKLEFGDFNDEAKNGKPSKLKRTKRDKRTCLSGMPVAHCEEMMDPMVGDLVDKKDKKYTGPKDPKEAKKSDSHKKTTMIVDDSRRVP